MESNDQSSSSSNPFQAPEEVAQASDDQAAPLSHNKVSLGVFIGFLALIAVPGLMVALIPLMGPQWADALIGTWFLLFGGYCFALLTFQRLRTCGGILIVVFLILGLGFFAMLRLSHDIGTVMQNLGAGP